MPLPLSLPCDGIVRGLHLTVFPDACLIGAIGEIERARAVPDIIAIKTNEFCAVRIEIGAQPVGMPVPAELYAGPYGFHMLMRVPDSRPFICAQLPS